MRTSTKAGNPSNAQGRPRDPSVDQAILRVALELFVEHGIAGASLEKIAKQAGVAKTSIYRAGRAGRRCSRRRSKSLGMPPVTRSTFWSAPRRAISSSCWSRPPR
jgi:hypothetical protein